MSSPDNPFDFPEAIPFFSRQSVNSLVHAYQAFCANSTVDNAGRVDREIASLLRCDRWRFQVRDLFNWLEDEIAYNYYQDDADQIWNECNRWREYWNEMEGFTS